MCSPCMAARRSEQRRKKNGLPEQRPIEFVCRVCGMTVWTPVTGPLPGRCTPCREKRHGRDQNRIRKQRMTATPSEEIDPEEVFSACRWTCALCGMPVDPMRRFPDQGSASLDHIVPIARHGRHEYANVQLAHLRCNLRKGARMR